MVIEHLISTMNRDEYSFLNKMNMKTSCVIVNQDRSPGCWKGFLNNNRVTVVSTMEKGLSKSRNMLLDYAAADICIICDDDVEYLDDYLTKVQSAYKRHPDADIIFFCFTHEKGKETRKRYSRDKKMHLWNISKAASVEITFNRERVAAAGIRFNELLGLGSVFPSGEENVFLADCLRAGLNIYHVPETICYAVEEHGVRNNSEWEKYLQTKGAAFSCLYKRWFFLYSFAFILIKKKRMFPLLRFSEALRYMYEGKEQYEKMEKKNVLKHNNTVI